MIRYPPESEMTTYSSFISMPTPNGAFLPSDEDVKCPKMTKEELKLQEILEDNRRIAKKGKEVAHEESDEDYDG